MAASSNGVKVRWFGQSFYQLTAPDGTKVIIDPFDQSFFDFDVPQGLEADLLLITHEHGDHNNVNVIGGNPALVRSEAGIGNHEHAGVSITGTSSYHDAEEGASRGPNTIYSFELGGVRFCHLGDLGHLLNDAQLEEIGSADVVFMPVGGHFTIPVERLDALVSQLKPTVLIPMHFKTEKTPKLPIAPPDEFLASKPNVKRINDTSFSVSKESLPAQPEIWLLQAP